MKRRLKIAVFTVVAAVLSTMATAGAAQSVRTHHVRDAVRTRRSGPQRPAVPKPGPATGPRTAAARSGRPESFLADVYNPQSPNYRHFSPRRNSPPASAPLRNSTTKCSRFARNNGLQVVGGSRDGMEVQVKGTVGAIEAALHVSLNTYPHPTENRNVLRRGSRADAQSVLQPVACVGARQFLDPQAACWSRRTILRQRTECTPNRW